tara:strand:+ start:361 stop:1386 length:1026 start_codon:yes stop_codon:yes gene_type:complete
MTDLSKHIDGFNNAASHSEVALFLPTSEDSSNYMLNHLADKLFTETTSINLRVFLVEQSKDPRIDSNTDLMSKSFIHGKILKDFVFPFQLSQTKQEIKEPKLLCPELLKEKYPERLSYTHIKDVNDPDFINEYIKNNPSLKMGFSVRNLQIFKDEIIDAFTEKGDATFLNSHPAILPGIRGLEGPFWTRVLGMDYYTTSLHLIIKELDAGAIIDYSSKSVNGDSEKPIAQYTRDAAPELADMIYKQIHLRLIRNGSPPGLKLQEGEVGYYTLPTAENISTAKQNGITLTDAKEQLKWLSKNFTTSAKDEKKLHKLLTQEYSKFLTDLNHPKEDMNFNSPEV